MSRSEAITLGFDRKLATLQEVIEAAIAGTLAATKNHHSQAISNLAV